MKKTLLSNTSRFGRFTKAFVAAAALSAGLSLSASAQWVVYEANELPADATPAFVYSNVSPSISETSPALVATEQSIIVDPARPNNKLLSYKIDGNPHTSLMWRQDFEAAPNAPTSATVVVRAKGMEGLARVLELDLDFAGFRETIFILANNTFTFNVVRGDLQNVSLGDNFNTMLWHTYRITKTNATVNGVASAITSLYIDENNTPIATGTTAVGGRTQNYLRFGDGQSSHNYGAHIDFIAWDPTGAFSPSQKPLPSNLVLASKSDLVKRDKLGVHPNPSNGQFFVTHPAARKGATVEVYAISGVKVATFSTEQGSGKTDVNANSLRTGIYTVVYTDGTQRITSRVVKR